MLAYRRFGPGEARLVETTRPVPGTGEVLIRPILSGICGTDLHVLHGEGLAGIPVPVTMGHEVCGEVVEIGPDASIPGPYPRDTSPLHPGDRVAVEPVLPCGRCFFCRQGQVNVCPNMSHLGVWQDGNFADYVVVPAWRAIRIPESVTDVDGLLVEVTACGMNCLDQAELRAGETVLVIGGGPMGQMAAQCALAAGASLVIMSEPNQNRREIAQRAGVHVTLSPVEDELDEQIRARTGGLGVDVALECVGIAETAQQAVKATRRRGRCVLSGLPDRPVALDLSDIVFGQKRIIGALASAWHFGRTIDLIASAQIHPSLIVDAVREFPNLTEALAEAQTRPDLCKIVIDHQIGRARPVWEHNVRMESAP